MCAIYIVVFLNKSLANSFISPYRCTFNFNLIIFKAFTNENIIFSV